MTQNLRGQVSDDWCIDNPKLKAEKIADHIKGPDFPTGGTVMGLNGYRQALLTGGSDPDDKGSKPASITVRAKVAVEEDGRETRLVVTEIPYEVQRGFKDASAPGLEGRIVQIAMRDIFWSVMTYLGIPFAAGLLSRVI